MKLTLEEQRMLDGEHGRATQKAMEILVALGTIYGAERMVPVTSVQIAGVSYDNLGEAGLHWLSEMADGGGKTRVLTTLNPAGMDIENWQALGISEDFARNQLRVIDAFARMNVVTTCSCTPYLIGNSPHFGQHIAWSESSAVCYANSVIGARSNREGGPSALAAALTGVTPEYGMHLDAQRRPGVTIHVQAQLPDNNDFGALGVVIGKRLEQFKEKPIAYITGIDQASVENLKSFCASVATYGGAALFHMRGVTPEADRFAAPDETIAITQADLDRSAAIAHQRRNRRGRLREPGLSASHAQRDRAHCRIAGRQARDQRILDHHRAPDQADGRSDGLHAHHRSGGREVRGGHVLRRRADQGPLQSVDHRQRQGVLLRFRQEQIQDHHHAIR